MARQGAHARRTDDTLAPAESILLAVSQRKALCAIGASRDYHREKCPPILDTPCESAPYTRSFGLHANLLILFRDSPCLELRIFPVTFCFFAGQIFGISLTTLRSAKIDSLCFLERATKLRLWGAGNFTCSKKQIM